MVAPIVAAAGKAALQTVATKGENLKAFVRSPLGKVTIAVAAVALVGPPAAIAAVVMVAVGGTQQAGPVIVAAQAAAQACQDAVAAAAAPTPGPSDTPGPAPSPTSTWGYDEGPTQLLVDCYSAANPTTVPVELQPGAWGLGGALFRNGQIPESAMCQIPWAVPTDSLRPFLRCDAEQALEALNTAWMADHGGQPLGFTSVYRTLAQQAALWDPSSNVAAPAGTSNHGWGLAVDFNNLGALGDFSSPAYAWMKAHAAQFGFVHPALMEPGGPGPFEPWHWEYWGAPTQVSRPGSPQPV